MSSWREETRADLKEAEARLATLVGKIAGDPTKKEVGLIWCAYLAIEKSIVFIRVEIGEENPGRFLSLKRYSVPDERQALQFTLRNLRKGLEDFELGDYTRALVGLREARNYLRATLSAKLRPRARARGLSQTG